MVVPLLLNPFFFSSEFSNLILEVFACVFEEIDLRVFVISGEFYSKNGER